VDTVKDATTAVVIRFPQGIGSLIRVGRRARGLSLEALAGALYMDPSNLNRIELESISCDWDTAWRAAQVLHYAPLARRAYELVRAAIHEAVQDDDPAA
jgi:transcriptional regulator with XRE-family HTH domain